MLSLRLVAFGHLVDVSRIGELAGIDVVAVPLLIRAIAWIGHFQIRNQGTLGGSLAHADPAAEYLLMDLEGAGMR